MGFIIQILTTIAGSLSNNIFNAHAANILETIAEVLGKIF